MPEATFNRVTLLGRLTRDPEIRSLEGGDQVANFSVATTDTWRNRAGEPQERSQFHLVVIWNQALIEATVPISRKAPACCSRARWSIAATDTDQGTRYVSEVVLSALQRLHRRRSTALPRRRPNARIRIRQRPVTDASR